MSTPLESGGPAQRIHPQATFPTDLSPVIPSKPDDPPWGVLQALATWLLSVAFLVVVPQLLALPYVAAHYPRGATRETLFADKTFILVLVAGFLPAHALTLLLAWAMATRVGRLSAIEVLGLTRSRASEVWKSAGLAILLFVIAWVVAGTFGGQETDLEKILLSSRAAALVTALVAVTTAPLVEEIIYRRLLYSALQRLIGRWFAVLIVASVFAGMHVLQYRQNIGTILSISLLSLTLTLVRARTGRLLPCFVIHLVFNGIQSLIIVFEPYLRALLERHDTGVGLASGLIRFVF